MRIMMRLTLLLTMLLVIGCTSATVAPNLTFQAEVEAVQADGFLVVTSDDVGFERALIQLQAGVSPDFEIQPGQVVALEVLPEIRESDPVQVTVVDVSLLEAAEAPSYTTITPEEAKRMMETESDHVILDVRSEREFQGGHIPGAILLPDHEIADRAHEVLPDRDQIILVYCAGGVRSRAASQRLAEQGYRNVYDFGGLNQWPYELEE